MSLRFMHLIVSCIQSGARRQRRRPASAAEPNWPPTSSSQHVHPPTSSHTAAALSLVLSRRVSLSPPPILVAVHQHSYPLLTLAPSPSPTLTFPRTTPTTRPLSAGASPFSPTFGYSYRQLSSRDQYKPYSRSLASPPLHMA